MDNSNSQSVITSDMEITGNVKTSGSIQIAGKIKGDVACGHDIELAKTGGIAGNITVNSIVIEGCVDGNVDARERIELKASATVNGDLKARRFSAEEGVAVSGKIEITPGAGSQSAPAATPAPKAEEHAAPAVEPAKQATFATSAPAPTNRGDGRGNLFAKR